MVNLKILSRDLMLIGAPRRRGPRFEADLQLIPEDHNPQISRRSIPSSLHPPLETINDLSSHNSTNIQSSITRHRVQCSRRSTLLNYFQSLFSPHARSFLPVFSILHCDRQTTRPGAYLFELPPDFCPTRTGIVSGFHICRLSVFSSIDTHF